MAEAMKDRPGWETEAAETSLAGDENSVPAGSDSPAERLDEILNAPWLVAAHTSITIDGGCDECHDPHQTITRGDDENWYLLITVQHSEFCMAPEWGGR